LGKKHTRAASAGALRGRDRATARPVPAAAAPDSQPIPAWLFAALGAVALAAFAHTLAYRFVFDDEGQILRNPWLRNWSQLGSIFTTDVWRFNNPGGITNYYRPLHMVLYMAGYALFGLSSTGYHALNLGLHALCTVLVAAVGMRVTGSRWIAAAGGLVFALHPIHVESVTWIAAVTDPLCAAFYFGALYLHLRDSEEGRPFGARTLPGPILFLLALLSKEMAFTFPLVAAWSDLALGRKLRVGRYAAYAGVFALYSVLRVHALGTFMVRQIAIDLTPLPRVLSTLEIAGKYLIEMFVPYDIRPYYVFEPTRTLLSGTLAASVAALAVLASVAWWQRHRRDLLFLAGYSILTLAPLLSLSYGWESLFQVRYAYIPSLGAALLAAWGAHALLEALRRRYALPERAPAVALGALVALACGIGIARTTWMWSDNATFFTEAIRRSPTSMLMANMLGRHYLAQGDYDRAEEWYRNALGMWDRTYVRRPGNRSNAYEGLGLVAFKRRDFDTARDYFLKAQENGRDTADSLLSLGMVSGARGDYEKALEYYRRAEALNPRSEIVHNNIAGALLASGKPEEAIVEARKALEIYPRLAEAYLIIGRAYADRGLKDQAREAFLKAREVDPNAARLVEKQLKSIE
jgi:tetratricopeptide (TPR) repeat protein